MNPFQNGLSTKKSQQLQRGAVSVDLSCPHIQQISFGGRGGQTFCSTWAAGGGFVGGWCKGGWVEWSLRVALRPAISLPSGNRVVATLVLGLYAID